MAIKKVKSSTRMMTLKQWNKFTPTKTLAAHLRAIASTLGKLPKDTRGKITMQIEIGRPTD